jgi:hypothetical protein
MDTRDDHGNHEHWLMKGNRGGNYCVIYGFLNRDYARRKEGIGAFYNITFMHNIYAATAKSILKHHSPSP